jgi:LmbE family N-acetylglucosaminyl deacetylase
MPQRVLAVGAHPDDIEFLMAGTLILLKRAGWEVHYWHLASGSCGTSELPPEQIARIRREEARQAAACLDAVYHEPLVADIEIFYERALLARVAAVVRKVAPDVLLTHSPADYMEDHQNTARLAATAAFCRGMRNFPTDPPREPIGGEVVVYHAQPHTNRDPLGRLVRPGMVVDVEGVLAEKRRLLACHASQKQWLDETQGLDSYLAAMGTLAAEVGRLSGCCRFAEGWRRRNPIGFCRQDADPLSAELGGLAHVVEAEGDT